MGGAEFEENQWKDAPMPRAKPVTMADVLLHSGIVSKPSDAAIMLCVFAFICIAASMYLLASAVPKEPQPLGHDILRAGEAVPTYVH